jgi:hypothetical protein
MKGCLWSLGVGHLYIYLGGVCWNTSALFLCVVEEHYLPIHGCPLKMIPPLLRILRLLWRL